MRITRYIPKVVPSAVLIASSGSYLKKVSSDRALETSQTRGPEDEEQVREHL
jgi:hypothetical protein